jgi:hypothetical protein
MPLCARSPRVATLCRAPGRAAMLGWPGPPWLGRGQPLAPRCALPHTLRAVTRLLPRSPRVASVPCTAPLPRLNGAARACSPVTLARSACACVARSRQPRPTNWVALSLNSSLFPPCRHDCPSRNIKSAGRSHLGPLHRMHGSAGQPHPALIGVQPNSCLEPFALPCR